MLKWCNFYIRVLTETISLPQSEGVVKQRPMEAVRPLHAHSKLVWVGPVTSI